MQTAGTEVVSNAYCCEHASCVSNRDSRDVNEGTVFLMNVYLNVMAEMQNKNKRKALKQTDFLSGSQSFEEMPGSSRILQMTAK